MTKSSFKRTPTPSQEWTRRERKRQSRWGGKPLEGIGTPRNKTNRKRRTSVKEHGEGRYKSMQLGGKQWIGSED